LAILCLMMVLGIESSCDETSVAVVKDQELLSNVIASQDDVHRKFGGVVPELAGRRHIEVISEVAREALKQAGVGLDRIEGVAVTRGPGLVVCLVVGMGFAKAISWARKIPLIGVNHLEGHMFSILLEDKNLEFPFIGLIASGGHTILCLVNEFGEYQVLGQTLDDAAGEALDKAAKVLGLGYPGGREIDRISSLGNAKAVDFPIAFTRHGELDYSFSGLKTALLRYVKEHPESKDHLADVAASFQEAVVGALTRKAVQASEKFGVKRFVLSGGVAANTRLRKAFEEISSKKGISLFIPSLRLCTDNAGMIALVGEEKLSRGMWDDLSLDARATLTLENWK
jgi:N6-L-threonylcarbamoyladenine synthase